MGHDARIDTVPHRQDTGRETKIKHQLQHSHSPWGTSIYQLKRQQHRNFIDGVRCSGGLPARTAPHSRNGTHGIMSGQAHRMHTMLLLDLHLRTEPGMSDGLTFVMASDNLTKQAWAFLNEKTPFKV